MRGRGSQSIYTSAKWHKIAEEVRQKKIGVLALQETHLTDAHVLEIERLYRDLKVFNSPDPDNPSGAGGVALVLNKLVVNHEDARKAVLVEGRAIQLDINWHRGRRVKILAVYAPTSVADNRSFWSKIEREIRKRGEDHGRPAIVLGDFNTVEDPIDRFPVKLLPIDAPDSLASLKRYLKVRDGWRETNPDSSGWTWTNAARSAMSRLDRIYVTDELLQASRVWDIIPSSINVGDHSRVTAEIVHLDSPECGPGRWAMDVSLVSDAQFMARAQKAAKVAESNMREASQRDWTPGDNVQVVWKRFKDEIARLAKARSAEVKRELQKPSQASLKLRNDLSQKLAAAGTQEEIGRISIELRKADEDLYSKIDANLSSVFFNRSAKAQLESEAMSKSWFRWAKDRKTRNTMWSFKKPGSAPPTYISSSAHMADEAGKYHSSLQNLDVHDDVDREQEMQEVVSVVGPRLTTEQRTYMGNEITENDVLESIRSSKNGSSPGLDGLIYELWKALASAYDKESGQEKKPANVCWMMRTVFQDVEEHGACAETEFTDGWMCPLYKKGDRSDISNYRPITLLNTDYKIFTKILALRLAKVAPALIDVSQAGFVRGRSITDQTKLVALMTDFAEVTEQNGMMIALDQEKAYDRVRHDYLIKVLEAYGFPPGLVQTVKHLYESARTAVMINGCMGKAFRVTRGVRQGDPLSCLLFNLAIEPLSTMLRRSSLKGYDIPGLRKRLIATLYADDTTVYLGAEDDFQDLEAILQAWCRASGARFNTTKTEIVPLGSAQHRENMIAARQSHVSVTKIPANIKIARDGEAIRILGAWPGNRVEQAEIWSTRLDKLHAVLRNWERVNPTMTGRGIVSRVIIGGHTQYLTSAQGMPVEVAKKLEQMTVDFVWGKGRKHTINVETLRRPINEGGIAMFDVAARNDAQYLVWVRQMLCDVNRPTWSFLAMTLYRECITLEDARRIPMALRINPFEQRWNVNEKKLPLMLARMWLAAKKHGLALDAPVVPEQLKIEASVWAHPAIPRGSLDRLPRKVKWCLKNRHAVRTIEDLEEIAEDDEYDHEDDADCLCENCEADRLEGCRNPIACQDAARAILSEIPSKWNPGHYEGWDDGNLELSIGEQTKKDVREGEACVVPRLAAMPSNVESLYRVFTNSLAIDGTHRDGLALRSIAPDEAPRGAGESITTIVASAIAYGGEEYAQAGIAVTFPDGERDAIFATQQEGPPTFDSAALIGFRLAAEIVPRQYALHIVSTSRLATEMMTVTLREHEATGWIAAPEIAMSARQAVAAFRAREGETTVTYVERQRLRAWPEILQAIDCARGMSIGDSQDGATVNVELAQSDSPGMALASLTQGRAYKAIRRAADKSNPQRTRTEQMMRRVQDGLGDFSGQTPPSRQVWEGLRDRCLSRKAREFLWKGLHDAHKVGPYFLKMKEPWRGYAMCTDCGVTETLEHILLQCTSSGQAAVWGAAREILQRKLVEFEPTLGTVLGCASITTTSPLGGRNRTVDRAVKIIVSESALLIWKIRCERRLEHGDDPNWRLSPPDVLTKWQRAIRSRKRQDLAQTNVRRYGKNALKTSLVHGTWMDALDRGNYNWYTYKPPGVLVGTGTPQGANGVG